MTPDERARHDAWHRTHRPGAGAARDAERERARQNTEARDLLNLEPAQRPADPEAARMEAALTTVRAKLAALEARNAKLRNDDEGIFS